MENGGLSLKTTQYDTQYVYFYCKIILMLVNMVKSSMLFHSSSFFPTYHGDQVRPSLQSKKYYHNQEVNCSHIFNAFN